MKKKSILLILIALLTCMAMIMASCGSTAEEEEEPMTFEKYIQGDEDVQEVIDDAMANDSSLHIEITGNDIIYYYDLSNVDGYTEEMAKNDEVIAAIESSIEDTAATYGGIAANFEEVTGISGIRFVINYTWGDEVLVTKTFTSADASADADDSGTTESN